MAQRDLFQREKRRVHATLYRILGSNADMDDLVQEAFLEIFRALRGFRGEASLGTWIDRITVRVAYAHIARRKAALPSLAVVPDVPAGDASAEERAMGREATAPALRGARPDRGAPARRVGPARPRRTGPSPRSPSVMEASPC